MEDAALNKQVSRSLYRLICYKNRQLLLCRYAKTGDDENLLYKSLAREAAYAQKVFPENYSLDIYQSGLLSLYKHLQFSLLEETEKLLQDRKNQLQSFLVRQKANLN